MKQAVGFFITPLRSLKFSLAILILLACNTVLAQGGRVPASPEDLSQLTGSENIYTQACSACHGDDGRGRSIELVGFETPLPDFTDCSFASREQVADWVGIAHEGGPLRGFSQMMPAFGQALSIEQLQAAIEHVKSFCTNKSWPQGEFNLPRSLFTAKAFVEDETLINSAINMEGSDGFNNKLIMEKRLGARSEFEVAVPFGWNEVSLAGGGTRMHGDVGDIAVELKHVLFDNLDSGTIISAAGEVVLPTGDGTTAVFEPQLLLGQLLPDNAFLQSQLGFEFPVEEGDDEMYFRLSAGKTFQEPNWGRSWTPMVEFLGSREISGGKTQWDIAPEMQISLNKRQHILVNFGLRIPVTDSGTRDTQLVMYFLWDWFDGGLREGW